MDRLCWGSPQQRRIAPALNEFPDVKLQYLYLGICAAALSIGRMRAFAWGGIIFCLWALYGSGVEAGGLGVLLMLLALPLHFFVLGGRAAPEPLPDPG